MCLPDLLAMLSHSTNLLETSQAYRTCLHQNLCIYCCTCHLNSPPASAPYLSHLHSAICLSWVPRLGQTPSPMVRPGLLHVCDYEISFMSASLPDISCMRAATGSLQLTLFQDDQSLMFKHCGVTTPESGPRKVRGRLWGRKRGYLILFCYKPGSVPLGSLHSADSGSRLISSLTPTMAPHLKNSRLLGREHWRLVQMWKTEMSMAEAFMGSR